MSVSIVMPCYNEEKIIEKVVKDYYSEIISKIDDSEFIIIDDCSNDNTNEILNKLSTQLPRLKILRTSVNSGHGKAVRLGYEVATKDYVFQVDSDNQFKSNDFWRLYNLKDDCDFILGFRRVRHDPLIRLLLAEIIKLMNFFLFGVWIKDVNCPFRIIKKIILDELLNIIDKEALAPNIMISILAKKKRIKMTEVPINHYKRRAGTTSLTNWKLVYFALRGFKQLIILKKIKIV